MEDRLELITITAAPGWQHVTSDGHRQPLAAWALVAVEQGAPFVVGAVVGASGVAVELVEDGSYVHEAGGP